MFSKKQGKSKMFNFQNWISKNIEIRNISRNNDISKLQNAEIWKKKLKFWECHKFYKKKEIYEFEKLKIC